MREQHRRSRFDGLSLEHFQVGTDPALLGLALMFKEKTSILLSSSLSGLLHQPVSDYEEKSNERLNEFSGDRPALVLIHSSCLL